MTGKMDKHKYKKEERMEKGGHYNPFLYIHGDKDAAVFVNTLITNTTPPEASKREPFWEKAETALLTALVAYLHQYCKPEAQTFSNVMRLLREAQISEDDNTRTSPLDSIFEEIRTLDPESFAVRQYDDFRMGAGKTLQSIPVSCAVRLQAFDLWDVAELTKTDDIDLEAVGGGFLKDPMKHWSGATGLAPWTTPRRKCLRS